MVAGLYEITKYGMNTSSPPPVVLVTGAARRIGATVARRLHDDGYRVIVHHGSSREDAATLVEELNEARDDSAHALAADLRDPRAIDDLARDAVGRWGRVDALVNNASTFFPTPLGDCTWEQWDELFDVNARAPWFLVKALANELRRQRGAVVNISDIYAERPLGGYGPYCAAKAALSSLTASLARELAPSVRVNAVAPGAILWPETGGNDDARRAIVARTPLARLGEAAEIAEAVAFLLGRDGFVTGQVINVDGGRSVVP